MVYCAKCGLLYPFPAGCPQCYPHPALGEDKTLKGLLKEYYYDKQGVWVQCCLSESATVFPACSWFTLLVFILTPGEGTALRSPRGAAHRVIAEVLADDKKRIPNLRRRVSKAQNICTGIFCICILLVIALTAMCKFQHNISDFPNRMFLCVLMILSLAGLSGYFLAKIIALNGNFYPSDVQLGNALKLYKHREHDVVLRRERIARMNVKLPNGYEYRVAEILLALKVTKVSNSPEVINGSLVDAIGWFKSLKNDEWMPDNDSRIFFLKRMSDSSTDSFVFETTTIARIDYEVFTFTQST